MSKTITCAKCGQVWSVEHLAPGASFTCQCQTIVCLPNSENGEEVQENLDDELAADELVEVPRQTADNLDEIENASVGSDAYASSGSVKPSMMYAAKPASGPANTAPSGMSTAQRLAFVNHGVQLVFIGILISILALLLLAIPWSIPLFIVIGIIQMGAGMVEIAGLIYCLFAPLKSGSRPFSIVALSCTAGGSLVLKLIEMAAAATTEEIETTMLTMLAMTMHMAGTGFFLFFLRKLALYTGQRQEADEAKFLAIFMLVLAGAGMVCGVFIPILGLATLVLFAALFIAHLIWLFQFLSFLDKLKFRKSFGRKGNSTAGWTQARKE